MRKLESTLPPGRKDSRRESARLVENLFGPSAMTNKVSVPLRAATIGTERSSKTPMRLEDLPDELCARCASPFEPRNSANIYCSDNCRNAANYDEYQGWRARARAVLACQDCGEPIAHLARKRSKMFCDSCGRERYLKCRQVDYATKRKPAIVAERERAIAKMVCQDCGASLAGIAQRLRRKRCDSCRIKIKKANSNNARNRRTKERMTANLAVL